MPVGLTGVPLSFQNKSCGDLPFATTSLILGAKRMVLLMHYLHHEEDHVSMTTQIPTLTEDTVYGKTFEGENFRGFRGSSPNCKCFTMNI